MPAISLQTLFSSLISSSHTHFQSSSACLGLVQVLPLLIPFYLAEHLTTKSVHSSKFPVTWSYLSLAALSLLISDYCTEMTSECLASMKSHRLWASSAVLTMRFEHSWRCPKPFPGAHKTKNILDNTKIFGFFTLILSQLYNGVFQRCAIATN